MLIYNLFPLLAGPCGYWEPHLERAANMGFDWVFVNPVQKPGSSGSLYSISDYFQLNPLLVDQKSKLAPDKQMQAALAVADKLGLKVMVDLVINHCAFDSDLTRQHREWFILENDKRGRGVLDPPGSGRGGGGSRVPTHPRVWDPLPLGGGRRPRQKREKFCWGTPSVPVSPG